MPKNQKSLKLGQHLLVAGCGLLLSFGTVPPASAYLSEIAGSLAPWLSLIGININPYIDELEAIENFYAQTVNKQVADVLTGLEWSLGEMGLPLAGEIPTEIQSVVAQVAADLGIYTPNAQKLEDVLMSEANKKYADAQAEILLGEKGQQEIQDSLKDNAKIVASSSDSAQLAQGMTISQDILRKQAQIEANSSVILGSIYEELVLSRINSTWNNQNDALLVTEAKRKNWEEEVIKTSNRAYIMRSTAEAFGYGLSPTTIIP